MVSWFSMGLVEILRFGHNSCSSQKVVRAKPDQPECFRRPYYCWNKPAQTGTNRSVSAGPELLLLEPQAAFHVLAPLDRSL